MFRSLTGGVGLALFLTALGWPVLLPQADAQKRTESAPFDEEAYNRTEAKGPIALLQKRINENQAKLKYDPAYGYLLSLLAELNVPQTSQVLVFSKTSSQRERISPATPRALFFNDNVYVAWIPSSTQLEISCVDPNMGAIFYMVDQKESSQPRLVRTDQCLECHTSNKTLGVPGYVVRSFATDENGVVVLTRGISQVDHRTPIAARWGGWYVGGTHGSQTHFGNLIGAAALERQKREPNYLGNVTELSRFFETAKYPEPTSDIVALMVLEHQTSMQNLITRLHHDATRALDREDSVRSLQSEVDAFLRYLLFVQEAPLTAPVAGPSGFAQWFEDQGPRDSQGRSLRQFNLRTRMFKYPCSYMIYSDAFERLPREMKLLLYRRLWNILSGSDTDPAFQKIPAETKRAIIEILIATKPGIPLYWML